MQQQRDRRDDDVLATARDWSDAGRSLALATVLETWGSSPRPVGSQLLADEQGNFCGSVSGGCVEGEVVRVAREVIAGRAPALLEFGVSDEHAWDVGLPCGGSIRVWVGNCPPPALLRQLALAREAGRSLVLLSSLDRDDTRIVEAPPAAPAPLREAVAAALCEDRSRYLELDGQRWFLQVLSVPLRLLVVGAVHVAQALAPMAAAAGFAVTLVDPRRAFAAPARFAHAELVHEWPDRALARLVPDRRTAVAVLSHDPKLDVPALAAALASDAFYVGVLGSRRTVARRREALRERGCEQARLARLHGPIGLDIGAATPAEIAIAILAQIIATLRHGGSGSG